MYSNTKKTIVLRIDIEDRLHEIWNTWNNPGHIINWYSGHQDWYTTESINNLKVGKSFTNVMKSKDGIDNFPFTGVYTIIIEHQNITYLMEDNRKVETTFFENKNNVIIIQKIEIENSDSVNTEALWWQTILINFKKYRKSIQ